MVKLPRCGGFTGDLSTGIDAPGIGAVAAEAAQVVSSQVWHLSRERPEAVKRAIRPAPSARSGKPSAVVTDHLARVVQPGDGRPVERRVEIEIHQAIRVEPVVVAWLFGVHGRRREPP